MIIGTEASGVFRELRISEIAVYEDRRKVLLTRGCLKFFDTVRAGLIGVTCCSDILIQSLCCELV